MKINYTLNENHVIVSFQGFPFDETKPFIEVENPYKEIHCGYSTVIDGVFNANTEQFNTAQQLLRAHQLLIEEMSYCKNQLTQTDYHVIKHAEGIEVENYDHICSQRAEWRARINEIEALLK